MITFIALIKNDIKLFIKDWKAVLLLLFMPLLFICLFVYTLSPYIGKSNFIEPFPIALVDNEDSARTRLLVNQLDEIDVFKEVLRVGENEAKELMSKDKIGAVIVIPQGFSRSLVIGENRPVTVIGNRNRPLQSYIAKNLAQSAANLVSASQSAINTIYHYNEKAGIGGEELQKEFYDSTIKLFMEALSRNKVFSKAEASEQLNLTLVEYFTAALIVIFLMFAGMPGMKMIVTQRCSGITRRLMTSPAKVWQVILSKFTVSLILSIMQFLIIIIFTSTVFHNYWGAPVKSIILLFFGIVFAVTSWSIFVSSVSKSPASADAIGNLGILLMAVIGGCIYPLSSMPDFVRSLSKLTISRWSMDGFMVLFSGNNSASVLNEVCALFVIGLALLIMSGAAFKIRRG